MQPPSEGAALTSSRARRRPQSRLSARSKGQAISQRASEPARAWDSAIWEGEEMNGGCQTRPVCGVKQPAQPVRQHQLIDLICSDSNHQRCPPQSSNGIAAKPKHDLGWPGNGAVVSEAAVAHSLCPRRATARNCGENPLRA